MREYKNKKEREGQKKREERGARRAGENICIRELSTSRALPHHFPC